MSLATMQHIVKSALREARRPRSMHTSALRAAMGVPASSTFNGVSVKQGKTHNSLPPWVHQNESGIHRMGPTGTGSGGRMRTPRIQQLMNHPEEATGAAFAEDRLLRTQLPAGEQHVEHVTEASGFDDLQPQDVDSLKASHKASGTEGKLASTTTAEESLSAFDFPRFSGRKDEGAGIRKGDGKSIEEKHKDKLFTSPEDEDESTDAKKEEPYAKVGSAGAVENAARVVGYTVGKMADTATDMRATARKVAAEHGLSSSDGSIDIAKVAAEAERIVAEAGKRVIEGVKEAQVEATKAFKQADAEIKHAEVHGADTAAQEAALESQAKHHLKAAGAALREGFDVARKENDAQSGPWSRRLLGLASTVSSRVPIAAKQALLSYAVATPAKRKQHEALVAKYPHLYGKTYA